MGLARKLLSRRNAVPLAVCAGGIAGILGGWAVEGMGWPANMVVSFAAAILAGGAVAALLIRANREQRD